MRAFLCTTTVSVENERFFRTYYAGALISPMPVDKLIIDSGAECKALMDHLDQLRGQDRKASDGPVGRVKIVQEKGLLQWPYFPARLGRISAKLVNTSLQMHTEPAPLEQQCASLKRKKPGRQHFRFIVINAFGASLGDATLGMTAMKVAAKVLSNVFESFSVDFLVCHTTNPANRDTIAHESWSGQVLFAGPTLQEFSRYDAYFDFHNFINLPRILEMPTIDWYLWWLGLDTSSIADEDKRNSMVVRKTDWQFISELLNRSPADKRVLFNPQASTPLRSMPAATAIKLAKQLLERDTRLHLVIDQPMDFSHERLINLSDEINSAGKFQCLIAQLDGVITVDSFAPQIADACSRPTVHICSTLPKDYYPYYPYSSVLNLPDADQLPAWKMFVPKSEMEWQKIQNQYMAAWNKLDTEIIYQSFMDKSIQYNQCPTKKSSIRIIDQAPDLTAFITDETTTHFRYENETSGWREAQQKFLAIIGITLKSGMTAVICGPGQSIVPLAIARALTPDGQLHLYEPRKLRRRLIMGDITRQHPTLRVNAHASIPVCPDKNTAIAETDPYCETDPAEWGNLIRFIDAIAQPIDALGLLACHCLFIMPPMPFISVIESAIGIIRKFRPMILMGAVTWNTAIKVSILLKQEGYHFWTQALKASEQNDALVLLGFFGEQHVNLNGYDRVAV